MQFQPIFKDPEQINSCAEVFLNNYHPTLSLPIPIEEIIDVKLGIDIIPIPGLKEVSQRANLDIDAFISSDFKSISVDEYVWKSVNTRYRFTLAHEIGHMMLHGYLYGQLKFHKIDEWFNVINDMPLKERGWVEYQANQFAGFVLVPQKILIAEYREAIKTTEKDYNLSYSDEPGVVIYGAIDLLAKKFCVSDEMMRIRLETDGLKK